MSYYKLHYVLLIFLIVSFLSSCADSLDDSGHSTARTPKGLVASAGARTVELSWFGVSDARSYTIYWQAEEPVNDRAQAHRVDVTSNAYYLHENLDNNVTYHYRVSAHTERGESGLSNAVQATPRQAPPAKPVLADANGTIDGFAAHGGDRRVTLDWPLNVSTGAVRYVILWQRGAGVSPGSAQRIEDVTPPFVHAGLENGQLYSYRLMGVNAEGESVPSDEIQVTPSKPAPAVPRNLSAQVGDGHVTIDWDAVSNAERFELYWSTTPGVTLESPRISNVQPPYTHAPLFQESYYYRCAR